MTAARIEELRAKWDRAVERDKPTEAVAALTALEELEPNEPRWAQRLGEALRRLGKNAGAEEAFVRASDGYAEKGFAAHAIAMAKLATTLNPARTDLLARLEPPKPLVKMPPLPATARGALPDVQLPPPLPARPVPLQPAENSSHDEVRFEDLDASVSIDITLSDVEQLDSVDLVADEDADLPPTQQLPEPMEPSLDRLGAMATFRLFAGLSREALLDLGDASELVELIPGAMMMVRNERAFALYALISGTARVTVLGSPPIRVGEGDVVGEGCLLDEGVRQADVKAETAVLALRIEKQKLDVLVDRYEALGDALFQLLARRLIMNLMHASPLFTSFDPKIRLELAQLFEVRRASPGTVLAERGKRSDGLYVLLAGNVTAKGAHGEETRIARGTAFGHAALVGAVSADTTVRAVSDAVLLRLPATKFGALAATYPPVLAFLAESADEPLPESVVLE